jgi:hypothetical protein
MTAAPYASLAALGVAAGAADEAAFGEDDLGAAVGAEEAGGDLFEGGRPGT